MVVHHLVVEDGEVESQPQADGVARLQLFGGDVQGLLVEVKGAILDSLELVTLGRFSYVSVVVSYHLQEKRLALSFLRILVHALALHDVHDAHALVVQLGFDFALVGRESLCELGVLGVLFDSGNST